MRDLTTLIRDIANPNYISLNENLTIAQAHETIRSDARRGSLLYLYIVDDYGRLKGVISTRDFLLAGRDEMLKEIYKQSVVSIDEDKTVLDACNFFTEHKYLALPVTNKSGIITGTVDVTMFTEDIRDLTERKNVDDIFDMIGLRISEDSNMGLFHSWWLRFPWLLTTIFTGVVIALISAQFSETLEKRIVLTFFLTLVLALAESVCTQSITITVRQLHFKPPTPTWLLSKVSNELLQSLTIALSSGIVIILLILLVFGPTVVVIIVSVSMATSIIFASLFGAVVPSLLHMFNLDPKVSAGPVSLALTDLATILIYFTMGTVL